MGLMENEEHFLIECPKYVEQRQELFTLAHRDSIHFTSLSNRNKFIWIMSNENEEILKCLGKFINNCMNIDR